MTLFDRLSTAGNDSAPAPWDQLLARSLVRPLRHLPITPNQITAVSLLIGLAAGWFYAQGGSAVHWGALLFVLATFLDHADGELARMTGKTSRFGHVFDHIAGGITHVVLFCAIGLGLAPSAGDWSIAMGLIAGIAVASIFSLRFEMERRNSKAITQQPRVAGFEVEDIMYLVAPVTWLGGLEPFLILSAIGAPLFLLYQIWVFLRGSDDTHLATPAK